jgi:hypothetical protein
MADFSSSPESRELARLKELHRAEAAPAGFRAVVAERLARFEAPAPKEGFSRWGSIGLLLLAAAAAVVLTVRRDDTRFTLLPEQPAASGTAEFISLSGAAVPGSLRWRSTAATDGSGQLDCQYLFSLEPEGSAPIRVRWTRCELPGELREYTQQPRSALPGPPRVFVTGRWFAPGQLEATEIRVHSRTTEP